MRRAQWPVSSGQRYGLRVLGLGGVLLRAALAVREANQASGLPVHTKEALCAQAASKIKRVTAWIRMVHSRQRLMAIWRIFRAKVAGHLRYCGVSFNTRALAVFVHQAMRIV